VDCHAVSQSKMVVGTRLIKKSQKTVDLGITESSTAIRCLFCHEKNAVSVANRTKMIGVWDHFNAMSLSKHSADEKSKFGGDTGAFDCLDCHTGLDAGVLGDGQGNATVHGVDASQTNDIKYPRLIGSPANAAQVEALTCRNAACHGSATAVPYGPTYSAKPAHSYGATTIYGQPTTGCFSCHGKHNSYQNTSLIVLRTDGTTSNEPTDNPNTRVSPDRCGACHTQDDGGAASDWMVRGHGMATGYGGDRIALNCLSCHDSTKAHDWTGADKRFSLPVPSGLSGMGTGKSMLSVCTTCHAGFTPHMATAGCLDCHEPHGQGLGSGADHNIMMVRRQVPVAAPQDTNIFKVSGIYGSPATFDFWREGDTSGAGGSSRGVCDNRDCHFGVQNQSNHAVWPLTTYFGTYGAEHGQGLVGNQAVGSNCQGCHKHSIVDPGAGFGGAGACADCHGYPPSADDPFVDNPDAVGVHELHIAIYGTSNCNLCHYNNLHDEAKWSRNTGIPVPTDKVQVAFNPSLNPTVGAFTPTYNPVTNTCSNLRCHNPDSGPVGTGVGITGKNNAATNNAPVWANAYAPINDCLGCHVRSPAANPDGGSHYKHDSAAAKGYSCRVCHANENAQTNTYSGTHAKGTLNTTDIVAFDFSLAPGIPAGGAYTDGASGVAGGTCANLYCHGASLNAGGTRAVAPNWPVWGTAATGACGTCHDATTVDVTPATSISTGNHPAHLTAAYGPAWTPNAATACDNCHTGSALTTLTHVDGVKTFANIDTSVVTASRLGLTAPVAPLDGSSTDRCTYCHSAAVAVGQTLSGTALAKQNWGTGTYKLACETCHAAAGPAWSKAAGPLAADPKAQAPAVDTFYASVGHGKPAGTYNATGAPAANLGCAVCHNTAVAHLNHTLGDKRFLAVPSDGLAYTTAVSEVCLDCHKVGQTANGALGRDATREATVHSGGVTGRYNTSALAPTAFPAYGNTANYAASPGYQCADCHNPHGTAKLAMVKPTLDGRLGGTSSPVAVGPAFDSSASDLRGLDPTTAANDGVCDACHRSSGEVRPHPDTSHPGNHNQGATGLSCVGCHDHKQSFVGTCTGCHGNSTSGNWWPDGTAQNGSAYPNRPGAHQQHIDAIYAVNAATLAGTTPTDKKNQTCVWCHPNPGASRSGTGEAAHFEATWTAPADLHGDGRAGAAASTYRTIAGVAQAVQGTYNSSIAAGGKTCSAVDCHYRVATPTTGIPASDGDGWYQPLAMATCSNCHGSGSAGAALPNSHPAHVNAPSGTPAGMAYGCWFCHPSGVDNVAYTTSHQTGAVNWSFATTLDPAAGGPRTETYNGLPTGTTAVKFGTGTFATCQNLYCHGNFPNGIAANAPTWGTAAQGACGTCHGVYGSPFNSGGTARPPVTSGNHAVHFQQYNASGVAAVSVGPRLDPHPGNAQGGCNACHNILENCTSSCHVTGAGANQPTGSHADGKVDFRNAVLTYPAPNPAFDPLVPNTLAASPACNNCHSTAVAVGQTLSGTALAKTPANWSNASYKLACVTCHNAADPAWSKAGGAATGAPNVRAPGKDTRYSVDNGGHGRSGSFSATGNPAPNYGCAVCHDEAKAHISHALDDQDRLMGALTAQTACSDCHAPGQTAPGPVLGRDATVEASFHASSVTGRYGGNPAYNYSCVVCHDPHGTTNIAMVKTTIADGMGAPATNVTLLSEAGLDPTSAADNGVCDRCHADAAQAHAGTGRPNNHNWGAPCLSCHDHRQSFVGSCTGCHGGGLASEGNGNWWPDSVPAGSGGRGTAYPNRLAAHQQHIDAVAVARFGPSPTTAQKNETCATCHPNPGGPNHEQNTAGSLASTADVHGDPQNTGTSFLTISGAANSLTTDTYDNSAAAGGKKCSNVDCHYRTVTPTTGAAPDGWFNAAAIVNCSSCHAWNPYTLGSLPNAHNRHAAAFADGGYGMNGATFGCFRCHPATVSYAHQDGNVDLSFESPWALDPAAGGPRTETYSLGTNRPVKYGGTGAAQFGTCSAFYCHGNFAGGVTTNQPNWYNTDALTPAVPNDGDGRCGTCHDTGTFDSTPGTSISTGNHPAHLTAAYGPNWGVASAAVCQNCHTAGVPNATHVNGWADFDNIAAAPASSRLGSQAVTVPTADETDRCTYCHSTATVVTASLPGGGVGTALAKTNWANGAYRLDCLTCHNATAAAWSKAEGPAAANPKVQAPSVYGDGTNFGAEVRGHSRPTARGAYPVSNNTPGNRPCGDCHNLDAAHLNHANDTTYGGNRMRASINGAATANVTQACQACHSTTGASPATKKDINTHSNQGYAARLEAQFTTACDQCHEPHGMVANGTGYNIFMMNPTVRVTAAVSVSGVRFEARTGNFSYNDTQGTNGDDICAVCHTNTANPGYPMAYNADGNHAAPAYSRDERGNNCASCHIHNQDSNLATADGLMPLQCNGCHSYPGLPFIAGTHRMSSPHDVHVGRPSSEAAVPHKGFECAKCHNGSAHNSGTGGPISSANQWASLVTPNINNRVQVRFDSWNPVAEAGNPADTSLDSTSFNDTANVCSNLYCHGATFAVVSGSKTAPVWQAGDGACGMCHDTDTTDTTVGTYLSTGNHRAHLADAWGPQFGTASETACANCHPAYGTAAATHANLTVDFANVDTTPNPVSTLGSTAPRLDPPTGSTDRCTHCHSDTNIPGVGVGTILAKQNWSNGTYKLDCLTCHNAAYAAWSNGNATGVRAPAKDASWATRGHGLPTASAYPWTPNRTGAGAACTACHSATAAHLTGAPSDSDRLVAAGNALCHSCHDGSGTGGRAQTRVSTHGNRSTTMSYGAKRSAFELNCVECHDVHGSTNSYMVNAVNTDGPLVPVRYYGGVENLTAFLFGGTVSFTASNPGGPDYASSTAGDTSKICQTCHTTTAFYRRTLGAGGHPNTDCIVCHKHDYDDNFAANSQDGFMPAGCSGCHGYPPVRPGEVGGNADYVAENYTGGGGFHKAHVEALKLKLGGSTDSREICGPCHGDGAGSQNHATSGFGPGTWTTAGRAAVNIRAKAAGQNSWDGMAGDPASATYGGNAVNAVGTTPAASAMTEANSRCVGVDCHGNPTAAENLNWFTAIADGPGASDGLAKSQACKGCHDETPAQWRVYNAGGTLQYTGNARNAAVAYYGTLSGYSRGGHGDANIRSATDPSFVDSAPSQATPIDCTACHSNGAAHFPAGAGDVNRLGGVAIQTNTGGLCNTCHPFADYPTNHHPSFYGSTLSNPANHNIVAATGQEIHTNPSSWSAVPPGGDHYEQNGYSAQLWTTNVDGFINWWGGNYGNANQDPPPKPVFYGETGTASPKASLPLARYIGNQVNSDQVMCTTCHNPHGTDLYTYDPMGNHQQVPDNNMLRLRDADNTLCNACH
jgi:predicted CxxxxCH...CXXCH cytochrome family protein